MKAELLRAIYAFDQLRFALWRGRFGARLEVGAHASPNLRFTDLRIEPGARAVVGPGYATERRTGNHVWLQAGAQLRLGRRVWLRTECGPNYITAAEGAVIELGNRCLINGAMLHANVGIRIYNVFAICWNIFAFVWNIFTFPLRLMFRIGGLR